MVLEHLFAKSAVDDQLGPAPPSPVLRSISRVQPLGTTLSLEGVCYHVPGAPTAVSASLTTSATFGTELSPITALAVDAVDDVAKTIARYALDDVWTEAFLDSAWSIRGMRLTTQP